MSFTAPVRRSLITTAIVSLVLAAAALAQSPTVNVKVTDGGVSLEAVDAPLDQVLTELGRAIQAKVMIETVLGGELATTRVTRSFSGLAPDVALRRLLSGRNYALVQSPRGVDEVRVFVDGKSGYRELTRPAPIARRSRPAAPAVSDDKPDDPAELGRLRQDALAAADPSDRQRALEDLSQMRDTAVFTDTITQAFARERDADVLQTMVDLAAARPEAVPSDTLRTFVASDRDPRARVQAIYQLASQSEDDPSTRAVLRALTRDSNTDVREAAQSALESLGERER